ncbi:MAG: hypothetical protein LBT87_00785, partial [Treponema sp.]|nr:hypothetical protein [Treponema sp.]
MLHAGCGGERPEQPPDDPLGRTLLIYDSGESSFLSLFLYNSDEARFRRLVKVVARLSYAGTFDLRRNDTPPDAKRYDTFFVGIRTRRDSEILRAFLAGFDFWDGTVIPFWMEAGDEGNETGIEIQALIQGARILIGGQGLRYDRGIPRREADSVAAEWMEGLRAELAARKALGEGAGEVVKAFAAAFPGRITDPEFRFSPAADGRADWYFKLDGVPYAYASGRFLTLDEAAHSEDFRPLPVYRYRRRADDPDIEDRWNTLASQTKSRRSSGAALSGWNRMAAGSGAERSPFYETLYACSTRAEAYEQQRWITFLDRNVQVHKATAAPLAKVEARILELEKTDERVAEWKKRL